MLGANVITSLSRSVGTVTVLYHYHISLLSSLFLSMKSLFSSSLITFCLLSPLSFLLSHFPQVTASIFAIIVISTVNGFTTQASLWVRGIATVCFQFPATYLRTYPLYGYTGTVAGFTCAILLLSRGKTFLPSLSSHFSPIVSLLSFNFYRLSPPSSLFSSLTFSLSFLSFLTTLFYSPRPCHFNGNTEDD